LFPKESIDNGVEKARPVINAQIIPPSGKANGENPRFWPD
jgi:hypothetical protein